SPAIWHGSGGEHLLLATAKEGNAIIVYDAATGDFIRRFGEVGVGKGAFSRPNGIAVVDDLLLIAERDNHRIQVFALPDFSPLGFFGESELIRPYGITVASTDTSYEAFITDNYETADEEVPPTDSLGHRVHHFRFKINNSELESEHVRAFGDTSGEGILHKVESLLYDAQMQSLMIADELELQRNIKIYTPEGEFNGSTISGEYFAYEPEGIALFACEADTPGYYIATDQHEVNNSFQVFDRKTLRNMGTFGGEATRNTDGVAISQQPFGDFSQGAFYPVHDDGSVAAIALSEIAEALQLKTSYR
ncbi:MAG: hypothetical protein ACLFT3_19940, partial [Cyclobacteriaceae bacterium]